MKYIPNFISTQGELRQLCQAFRILFLNGSSVIERCALRQGFVSQVNGEADLSLQKLLSSSIVLEAPRMRANRTSTPTSPTPQNALQKSRERLVEAGAFERANFESDVAEACRLADILWNGCESLTDCECQLSDCSTWG